MKPKHYPVGTIGRTCCEVYGFDNENNEEVPIPEGSLVRVASWTDYGDMNEPGDGIRHDIVLLTENGRVDPSGTSYGGAWYGFLEEIEEPDKKEKVLK